MSKVIYGFCLAEEDLAKSLEITRQKLDEIIQYFDADPNDEWELIEGDHFRFVNKNLQERLFSLRGAHAIAEYIRANSQPSFWDNFVEFLTRHKQKIRESFVKGHIVQNSSSLVSRFDRSYLSKADTVKILGTSPARLNQSFKELQAASKMQKDVDFCDMEEKRYYSIRGLSQIANDLANKLTSKDRRLWCGAVTAVGDKTVKEIESAEARRKAELEQRIKKAKTFAKKRDNHTCQVTGNKLTKHSKCTIVMHHIYSGMHYEDLVATPDNLIALDQEVHQRFHGWMGGNGNPCTPDDLLEFVQLFYSEHASKIAIYLLAVKQKIGAQSQPAWAGSGKP
jgi:hypothetical protein